MEAAVAAVIWVEGIAALAIVLLLLATGVRRRHALARQARIRDAVQQLVAAAISGQSSPSTRAPLPRSARRAALHEVAEYSRAVGGSDRRTLAAVANGFGLREYVAGRARSRYWWRRLEAARLATQFGVDLTDVRRMAGDSNPLVRAQGATAAGAWNVAGAEQILLAMLGDRAEVCRFEAKQALVRMRADGAHALIAALGESPDALRDALLDAAAAMPTPEMLDLALANSASSVASTREAAVRLLAGIGGAPATERIASLLDDDSPAVRCASAAALGRSGAWTSAPDLARHLDDPSHPVRLAAASGLQRLGAPGTLMLRRIAGSGSPRAAAIAQQTLDIVERLATDAA